ncbi:MAG: nuclear transport factor 2 family protein [Marmoricola sp.]
MTGGLGAADRWDLTDLVSTYAAAVDGRDWEALGALFTARAVLVTPDPPRSLTPVTESRGRDAIVATVSAVGSFACTVHHVTGSTWSVAGDAVLGRTTGVAHHVEVGPSPRSWAWHVVYADAFVPTDLGWRFERRELTVRMIEERPLVSALPFSAQPFSGPLTP